jgi:phi LC3 family holin
MIEDNLFSFLHKMKHDAFAKKELTGLINWKVRFRNRTWVLAFVSQILLVGQLLLQGLNMLGLTDFQLTEQLKNEVLTMTNSVFILFSFLGLVQDPTTKGYRDSQRAKLYRKPH